MEQKHIGKIEKREIAQELKDSYLDYSMSVIVARALPDARDGLKPVHRRILYAMNEMGLRANAKFRKSANVSGLVLAYYHPHGDAPVYEAMMRMAQDFSLRYPLVQGQGNLGSIDGDPPAHQRYTEAKLSRIAEEMLESIDEDTVDFTPNYDGTKTEPKVLPAKIPNLFVNGAMGIAVGMATNIPPHNLSEVCDGAIHLIDNPDSSVSDLMEFVKGPDFPTGGAIYDKKAILECYATGKGTILQRATMDIVERKAGQYDLLVKDIPYGVNKSLLLERIAQLVKDKKIEGIKNLRDESDKEGIRVVIELKSDANPERTMSRLYKLTQLENPFHANFLALVDGIQPQILSLKGLLEQYISHRKEVVERRSKFRLKKAKERAHILEGLSKALDKIDAIIAIIKKSKSRSEAQEALQKRFKFSDPQAKAILEIQLAQLARLEREKIEAELKEKLKEIKDLETLLKDAKKILWVVKKEITELKEKYKDERKTKVVQGTPQEKSPQDLIPNENTIITLTRDGFVKRTKPDAFKVQQRGGKGVYALDVGEGDVVEHLLISNLKDRLLFFSNTGSVFQLQAYEIPEAPRTSRGRALVNFIALDSQKRITALLNLSEKESKGFLAMVTKKGIIKKTPYGDFADVRRSGILAIKLNKGDELKFVAGTSGNNDLILLSKKGQGIIFSEKDVRPMGRNSSGVKAMKLGVDDEIVGLHCIEEADKEKLLLLATQNGFAKKTKVGLFRKMRRGGKGVRAVKVTQKNGNLVASCLLEKEIKEAIFISGKGKIIKVQLSQIPEQGRSTQGVRAMRVSGDQATSLSCV